MSEPVAHVYKNGERVLELENPNLVSDFEESNRWTVERL